MGSGVLQKSHCHLPQSGSLKYLSLVLSCIDMSCIDMHGMKNVVLKKSRNATLNSVTLRESYTSILCSDAAGFSGPELISDHQKDSENVCCTQMSPQFQLVSRKNGPKVPKTKGAIQTFISDRSKSKCLSWYGVQQSKYSYS